MSEPALPPTHTPETLPPLPAIVAGITQAADSIAAADRQFQRVTLADRLWIGVLCLAAKEHHAVPVNERGQGRKSKRLKQPVQELAAVNPQGVLSWYGEHVPGIGLTAIYKYMAAARGAGLDAWSTEAETRALVAQRLAEFDQRGTPLTLALLAAQGKDTSDQPGDGAGAKQLTFAELKFQAIQALDAQIEEIAALKDRFTARDHEVVTRKLVQTLQDLTGVPWEPALPPQPPRKSRAKR